MRRYFFPGERFSSHLGISSQPRTGDRWIKARQCRAHHPIGHVKRLSNVARPSRVRLPIIHPQRGQEYRQASIREITTTAQLCNTELAVPRPEDVPEDELAISLPTWSSAREQAEYTSNFYRIIENRQPNQILHAMTDPRSVGLVGSMSQTTFLAAFKLLSPDHFVKRYRDLYYPLHWWGPLKDGIKSIEGIFDDFVRDLTKIIHYRAAGGHPPQLAEYTHLLNCARVMGNAPLADEIWDSMYDHQVIPDTACFNHFMGATIWDHCYVGKERFNLQINPDSYKKRRMNQPNVGWQGYGTAEHSVRKVIMNIFSDMTQIGLSGDEQTYINIIVAAGRVGDKDAVYNVLQAVWNVDVRALMAEKDNSKVPQVTQYETWSGLYPTERLLFAVAHVFGATCDIHAAIRTIDFLSSSYDIPISHEVWHELLERTFVLTKTHQGKQAELDRWGTVPKEMVYQVFETMTAEPYNVPPTVKAYRMLSQTSAFLGNFKKCQSEIRQAHDVYSKTLAKRKEARDMVMQCLQPILNDMRQKADNGYSDPQTDPLLFQCPLLAEAIHIYDILRLEVYQQLAQLKRIAKTISSKKEWQDFSVHTWERRVRPKFHEEWKDFLADFPEFECNEAGKIRFEDYYCYRPRNEIRQGLISVRRLPGHAELFTPVEEHVLDDNTVWKVLLEQWPGLDPSVSPINRLYSFQVPPSKSLIAKLKKLHCRFDVPSDFPVAAGNNATGGFYARLVRQGLLMNTHRTPYWRDGNHWLED